MALDTTVGGAYATSYVELIEADDFITNSGCNPTGLDAWLNLEDGPKEFRLRVAAQFIGVLPLRGYQSYEYQALSFPRSIQPDQTIVPDSVKEAQSLIAYLVVDKNIGEQEAEAEGGDILLENALVKSVRIMGILEVGLQNTMDAATIKQQTLTTKPLFYKAMKAYGLPIWFLLRPYLAQFRGGTFATSSPTLLTSPDYND
jgi:hypothetical protein